jgi:hypothetical protein
VILGLLSPEPPDYSVGYHCYNFLRKRKKNTRKVNFRRSVNETIQMP